LSYRSGEFSLELRLEDIDDLEVRALLRSMLALDPSQRQTAAEYAAAAPVFPPYFG
jgi:phosphoinositide-3-kinase regulatory subunit 4